MAQGRRTGIVAAVIGSGSSYTPMIVREFAKRSATLPVEELRLYDVDRRRQKIVGDFCKRLEGDRIPVTLARSLPKAVEGAHFVMSQFRVGQLAARHRDIMLGLKYDLIGQETTGVGGFAKALRTIPATLAVCRAIRRHGAPGAWLVNFTNPAAIITEAVLKYGDVPCVGLCNGPWGIQRRLADDLNEKYEDLELDYVGSNHLAWVRGVRLAGRDITARVRRMHANYVEKNIPKMQRDPVFERAVGLPYNGYLQYYYYTEEMLDKLRHKKRTRAQEALAIERKLLRKYANPRTQDLPEELGKRGGSGYSLVAVNIVEAIANNLDNVQIVNTRNGDAVEGVEEDAVVEISSRIGKTGARPIPYGKLEAPYRGLLQVVKAYEELAVQAGVKGDLEAALHALVIHPLGPTADHASALLKDLLRINRDHLPQFTQAKIRRFFRR